MRITKFGHAGVRLEHDGRALALDPGVFTDAEAVDGVDAILITHLHPDHLDVANLRTSDAPIFTIAEVAAAIRDQAPDVIARVQVVESGAQFDAAGLPVTVIGEWHNVIHRDIPRVHNAGYVVGLGETAVYHPGDALTLPGVPVDVLLAPSSAPWLRSEMAIDFVRAVEAPVNLAIHDRVYTEAGHAILQQQMDLLLPETQVYRRISDGADLAL